MQDKFKGIDVSKTVNWKTKSSIPEIMFLLISKSKRDNWESALRTELCTKVITIVKDNIDPISSL